MSPLSILHSRGFRPPLPLSWVRRLASSVPLRFSVPALLLVFPTLLGALLFRAELRARGEAAQREGVEAMTSSLRLLQRRIEPLAQRGELELVREEVAALAIDPSIQLVLVSRADGTVAASTRLGLLDLPIETALARSSDARLAADLDDELETVRITNTAAARLVAQNSAVVGLAPLQLQDLGKDPGLSASGGLLMLRSLRLQRAAALRQVQSEAQRFGLILLALAAFIWFWFHQAMTRRVGQLVAAAGRLASDDLTVRTGFAGRDELSKIGQAFDAMAERMQRGREELRLSQQQARMADRLATVGTLAAGVAHEINNPLAYVIANLDYVANAARVLAPLVPPGNLELQGLPDALADAQSGARRVRSIVADMKTLSRRDDEDVGPIDLVRTLEGALNIAAHEMRSRAMVVRNFAAVPAAVGNEGRLAQVFLNLLVNAAHAIPRGQTGQEIRVGVGSLSPGYLFVDIEDTGQGIAADVLPHIFDPFFTTKPRGEGTGLGLSICHTIVRALGGRIEVRSELGKGTRFRVVLRAAAEELARAAS